MAADIDAHHLLLKGKQHLPGILPHIRHTDIKLLLILLRGNVKESELSRQIVLFIFYNMIQNLYIDAHALLPGAPQAVHGPRLDKVLDGPFVHIPVRDPGDKIFQIGVGPPQPPLLHDGFDHRAAHPFYGRQGVADISLVHRKTRFPLVDVRRQYVDSHAPAGQNILRHLLGIVDHRSEKRRHELHGIVIFQPGRLQCNHRVAGRMGFVERIIGKIHHLIKDPIGRLFVNPPGQASRYAFFGAAVHKISPLLLHDGMFLFTHGPAHQIAAPHGVASQIPHDLHDLLLINHTAVGIFQNRLQLGTGIAGLSAVVLALDVLGNKIHGAGTIQGNTCHYIFKILRAQFLHEAFHAAALQLEDPLRPACADVGQHFGIIEVDVIHVQFDPPGLFHKAHRVPDHREVAQPQEIHLQKSQFLQGILGVLSGDGTVPPSGQGYKLIRRLRADHHSGGMHAGVAGQALQTTAHVYKFVYLFLFPVQLVQLRVLLQGLVQSNIQIPRHQLGNAVHIGIGKVHDPAHVPDHPLGPQGTEGDDLHHFFRAVLPAHIVDHVLPPVGAEINIDIRHGHPFRVQKALEQQTVADGVDVRDFQAVGHDTPRRAAPPGPHRDAVLFRVMYKIPHNEKIIHKTHTVDHIQFIIQAFPQGHTCVPRRLRAVPITLLQAVGTQFLQITPGVIPFRHFIAGEFPDAKLNLHMASVRNLLGVLHRLPGIGEEALHLLLALDIVLATLIAHPILVRQFLARLQAEQDVMGLHVSLVGIVYIIGDHQGNLQFPAHIHQFHVHPLLLRDAVVL